MIALGIDFYQHLLMFCLDIKKKTFLLFPLSKEMLVDSLTWYDKHHLLFLFL